MLRLEALGTIVGAEVTANGRARVAVHLWRVVPERAALLTDCANLLSERERAGVVSKLPAEVQEDARLLLDRLAVELYAKQEEAGGDSDDDRDDDALFGAPEEPWPKAVDGAQLLDELVATFRRFLILPTGAAEAMALWTFHAHAHDAAEVSPLLAFTSPEKRCGKTRALRLIGALTPRPLPGTNITPAAVFRAVEAYRPTLLVDEADTFLKENDELRGILNAAHDRASAKVVRVEKVGDRFVPRAFSTWCPKAVAMIGELADTLADRSISIPMRRRARGEMVERFRLDRLDSLAPLRRQAMRWAADALEDLRSAADPAIPDELHDRAADNWRPLLAIADEVGCKWPSRARRAALTLAGADVEDAGSSAVLLLADLHQLFVGRGVDRLSSQDILAELHTMEERPWPEWSRGKPITATGLARLLKPLRIAPGTVRDGGAVFKGYLRDWFSDAWRRYLPSESVTSVTSRRGNDLGGRLSVTSVSDVTDTKSANSLSDNDVTGVTDEKGGRSGQIEPGDAWEPDDSSAPKGAPPAPGLAEQVEPTPQEVLDELWLGEGVGSLHLGQG